MRIARDFEKLPTDYYVYAHYKLTTGEMFYVGKGKGNRVVSTKRSTFWKKIVNKHGVFAKVLIEGLQEWAAYEIERGLVNLYGRINDGTGILCNLTDGGEGAAGQVITEKRREQYRLLNRGRRTSDETKKILSEISIKNRDKISQSTRDKNIYTFVNADGTVFTGTRVDFRLKFSVAVNDLFLRNLNKRKEQSNHWTLLRENEEVFEASERVKVIQSKHKRWDNDSYTFIHKDGRIFTGTRKQLSEEFGIVLDTVHGLFGSKPRKTVKGWSLIKEQDGTNC